MVVTQVLTLVGVAIGALASFLATSVSERSRHRREIAKAWEERKYECYAEYVHEVKAMSIIARRMAAFAGLTERSGDRLDPKDGASMLTEAEVRRSIAAEKLRLLSDTGTITAAARLSEAAWRLEWIARGKLPDASSQTWHQADEAFVRAFDDFHRCARQELAVPGRALPRPFIPLPNREEELT
jgi:hypothetical protein